MLLMTVSTRAMVASLLRVRAMQPNIHTHMTLSYTVVRCTCLLEYHDIHITCQSVKVDECTFFVWDNPDS